MSSCACIYVEDFDPAEFYNSRIVTAKKKHICGECGKDILPGSKYEYAVGSWEGDFTVYKTCGVCLELRNEFFCNGWFFEQVREYLWNHIQDMGGDLEEGCLCGLSPDARVVVADMIAKIKEEDNE